MKNSLIFCLTVFVGAIAGSLLSASFLGSPTYAAAQQPTEYKLAVVNRKEVYDSYNKQKSEMTNLEAERDRLQDEVDTLAGQVTAKRDSLEGLPEAERARRVAEIEGDIATLRAEIQKRQADIDVKTKEFLQGIMADIEQAVTAIGNEGDYHMIFESDPNVSSVVYYSNTVDITPQVITRLNSGS